MNPQITIFLLTGTLMAAIWCILLLVGSPKYQHFIAPLPKNSHYLRGIYPIGFQVLDMIGYKYDNSFDSKRLNQCRVIYGSRYAEYYYRINCAAKVSVVFTVLVLTPLLYSLTNSTEIIFGGIFAAGIGFYIFDDMITDAYNKRESIIIRDFPEALSKLTLLINAGMIMREAWEKVSEDGEGLLYDEMKITIDEIRNGTSEVDAYINFGNRCSVTRVKKFSSILVQNLLKGNRELVQFLKQMTKESWEEKKHSVRRLGEKASSKLLIPIGLMFLGILALIIIPMAKNFSGL